MEELKKHGTLLPPEIIGLTDEQVVELKLIDKWGETCIPSGGYTFHKDPIGRRNGKQPNENMQNVLTKTIEEAKACVSKVNITVISFFNYLHIFINYVCFIEIGSVSDFINSKESSRSS